MSTSEITAPAEKPAIAAAPAPKTFKVGKPFNTHNRRFKPDDPVTSGDLTGSALDFDHLKKRGFIVAG
jgi:hypothetical protein